ncbi:hypothetical protein IV203_037418 [Nitzschia inconspicua]|uniref:Uncharacterized protein n=1 Tax=Nitzschia inconspicua TaxID=303405 RepID=A0A9K3LPK0_9STRA|nr:hypothetical protein IV203_037418 [Nitzschia inconspicua]
MTAQEKNDRAIRIPPPPLLPEEQRARGQGHLPGPTHPWILNVRCQTRSGALAVVRVQVYPNMTDENLGHCIVQALSSYDALLPTEHTIVGLFGERDSVFYALQRILSSPESEQQMFSLHRPLPKEDKDDDSWYLVTLAFIVFGVTLAVALYHYGELIWSFSSGLMVSIFQQLFDIPIRELYRHGPYLIGWENLDLPTICSRITYHGDREFWRRNLEECQAIYGAKEEAFVRVCRPIMYVLLFAVLFLVIRHLVAVYGESKRDRTDRAVVETYHAFQNMIRVITRSMDRQQGGGRRH